MISRDAPNAVSADFAGKLRALADEIDAREARKRELWTAYFSSVCSRDIRLTDSEKRAKAERVLMELAALDGVTISSKSSLVAQFPSLRSLDGAGLIEWNPPI